MEKQDAYASNTESSLYALEVQKFLEEFIELASSDKNLKKGNDKMMHSAFLYEKFRTAMEYQEDHLIFKNAVSRIIRRQYALSFSVTADSLFNDLLNELAWADYINIDSLTDEEVSKIKSVINRYLVLLGAVKSRTMPKYDAQKIIIGWMSSEIDEIFFCRKRQELMVNFAYNSLKDNLKQTEPASEKLHEIQLKLSILTLIFKPDYSYAQYWLAKKIFPEFEHFNLEYAAQIGKHFDNVVGQIDKVFKNRFSKEYLSYTKRYIVPFILIKELPNYQGNLKPILDSREKLTDWLMDVYDRLIDKTKTKVWRGTFRALIFILLTKISLAFIVEMPFDQMLRGSINYIPLAINIFVPPLIMLFAGLSVKTPSANNRPTVYSAVSNLLSYGKLESKSFYIGEKKKSPAEVFFNVLYFIFNLAVLFGVTYLLFKIGFNLVSVTLFFIFISAVSFFSFRIRNIALELAIQVTRENILVSIVEFVFLPFILIGKILSNVITKSNPFTITLDFLIEAPLKSIIKITNSWLRFIRQKKEDLDF
jgi:hypothetical protein